MADPGVLAKRPGEHVVQDEELITEKVPGVQFAGASPDQQKLPEGQDKHDAASVSGKVPSGHWKQAVAPGRAKVREEQGVGAAAPSEQ